MPGSWADNPGLIYTALFGGATSEAVLSVRYSNVTEGQIVEATPESLAAGGWTKHEADGFSSVVSPFWYRVVDDVLAVGFIAEARHRNEHIGTVHGGAIMTFADIAGGFAVVRALGHARCATVNLQANFMAAPKAGEFITCVPEIARQTRDLLFVRGLIHSGDRAVASIEGIWKVLAPR